MPKTIHLEEQVTRLFEEVKDSYYRPPISGPEIIREIRDDSGKGTAFMHWLNMNIGINLPFVEELSAIEDRGEVIKGLFTHEFGHYLLHPRDYSLYLYLSYKAHQDFGELGAMVYGLFTDFQNNNLIVRNGFHQESLKKLIKASYELSDKNPLTNALFMAYGNLMGFELKLDSRLNGNGQNRIKHGAQEFCDVAVTTDLDTGIQYGLMRQFGNTVASLVDSSKIPYLSLGGSQIILPEDIKKLPQELRQILEERIRELIRKLPKGVYEDIKKHYFGERKEDEPKIPVTGSGEIDISLADHSTVGYYKDAAKEFGIYIRPKRILSVSSTEIPIGKKDFQPTDNPLGMDLRFSGGKILPGLTQSERRERIPYPSVRDAVPNLILYKDASGSEPNPSTEKSYGTIAGAMFVMSYLRSGANVGVALFDGQTSDLTYSRNEDALLSVLCGYKGGGTQIDMESLLQHLGQRNSGISIDSAIDIDQVKRNPFWRQFLKKNAQLNASVASTGV